MSTESKGTTAQKTGSKSSTSVWTSDDVTAAIKKYSFFIGDALNLGANVAATEHPPWTIVENAKTIQDSADAVISAVKSVSSGTIDPATVTSLQAQATIIQNAATSIQNDGNEMQDLATTIAKAAEDIHENAKTIKDEAVPTGDSGKIKQNAENIQSLAKTLLGTPKTATDFLFMAIDSSDQGSVDDAEKHLIETSDALSQAVRDLGRWNRWRYKLTIYTLGPIVWSLAFMAIFGVLIFFWPLPWPQPTQSLSLPEWAGPIGGIGAGAQVIIAVVVDLKNDGYSADYRRMWAYTLPFLGVVFGFVAYAAFRVGLLSLGQTGSTTTGNQILLPVLIVFLAGFSTDWFIGKLDLLAPAPSSSSSSAK